MTLKTFKDFINEILSTTSVHTGLIKNKFETTFFYEKLNQINLRKYMDNFKSIEARKTLISDVYGKANRIRFLLFYNRGLYYIFVFNANVAHQNFAQMLDNSKSKFTPIVNHEILYLNSYEDDNIIINLDIKNSWCIPGIIDSDDSLISWASPRYLELLAKSNIHKLLGFDDDTWKSLYET
jgi:hypothetical protein